MVNAQQPHFPNDGRQTIPRIALSLIDSDLNCSLLLAHASQRIEATGQFWRSETQVTVIEKMSGEYFCDVKGNNMKKINWRLKTAPKTVAQRFRSIRNFSIVIMGGQPEIANSDAASFALTWGAWFHACVMAIIDSPPP